MNAEVVARLIERDRALEQVTRERDALHVELETLKADLPAMLQTGHCYMNERDALRAALKIVLDQIDYTVHACGPTDMVAACLSTKVIKSARASLAQAPACRVCGESHNPPCHLDDFPEPGDIRETGR